jgi:hypothetical protein
MTNTTAGIKEIGKKKKKKKWHKQMASVIPVGEESNLISRHLGTDLGQEFWNLLVMRDLGLSSL